MAFDDHIHIDANQNSIPPCPPPLPTTRHARETIDCAEPATRAYLGQVRTAGPGEVAAGQARGAQRGVDDRELGSTTCMSNPLRAFAE